jgi:hypothetical protein
MAGICGLIVAGAVGWALFRELVGTTPAGPGTAAGTLAGSEASEQDQGSPKDSGAYSKRMILDTSGFTQVDALVGRWSPDASLEEIAAAWRDIGSRSIDLMDRMWVGRSISGEAGVLLYGNRAMLRNYEGKPELAAEEILRARALCDSDPALARQLLATVEFFQGVTALRKGENDNCIMCRGESSCILPIAPSAVHTNPEGSRAAIRHFTAYLERFPDDLQVRWLLNLAHMTLGEYPGKVDPRYLVPLGHYMEPEFDIGRFRDVGHLVGLNRYNMAGGAVMDDFDGDGLLDVVTSTSDPTERMALFRNLGDGTFEERGESAGLGNQYGGLYCVQADYDNDGWLDLFVPRGAWFGQPVRPSLLRNDGRGGFVDVTRDAGLIAPMNSGAAAWADYDNDGWLDLFVCCERQPCRLYHNRGDGTFEERAHLAGIRSDSDADDNGEPWCKGASWIDFDNDEDPDLFLNHLKGLGRFYRNNGDGTFTEISRLVGIDGPEKGFSCWAWDYDNDGWLDLFASSYDFTPAEIVRGLIGESHAPLPGRLYRNVGGEKFEDHARDAGIDAAYSAMGSNFADFDNDGYLDFYLGTGEPTFSTLVPNRMFRNVQGRRFAEITASAGTGNLQKGHAVACGDWDRDGDVDLFIQMGGAVPGDRYHDILFQNPGQGNHSLSIRLIGKRTNRSAIGSRIKAVVAGPEGNTVYRHISSGSSFGANTLEQTIGLGKAEAIATLEIHWPTSGTTQTFHDIPAGQLITITEFDDTLHGIEPKPIPLPE